ncbi:alpha-hydroxy-acid oxidizing protein [Sandaracinobacter sp. RS1-74]|uniref:alpha-hydroxy acid oxidase n=1 Tax=Sandaracinobacteroides sayramensis TaxID=2913411 RepID=UPI001EDABCC4|nr:alpha-hydroxy acid oxidase [Sandaracinobacteroides sayramensis]MCG2840197.1 alpha-hydroxy-acid oxidizing protein [Sandaracinobacteroides sayramensis]
MRLSDCHNVGHFRELARRRLPGPVFHYIDGAADDEITRARNTTAFDDVDLVPNVLAGVAEVDMSVTVLGRKLAMPLFLSPTALQRLFHWQGERAVGRAASAFGTYFGVSSLSTVALEDIGRTVEGPKMLQLYVHKDEGLNQSLVERARNSGFDCLTLTVDTIVGGNRERCLRTGFTSPPRFTPASVWEYATKPGWALNYLFRERFSLPNLEAHLSEGSRKSMSVADYFTQMLDQTLDWKRAESIRKSWGDKPFCLKGVMSVEDARRAIGIGATAIMVSNHGGRQLDGSRAPFDQIAELADAVGDEIEIICDGGIRRGTHVLKALAAGARACSGGRLYLYALGAAGEEGVRSILAHLKAEIERDMKLMGVTRIDQLDRSRLRYR